MTRLLSTVACGALLLASGAANAADMNGPTGDGATTSGVLAGSVEVGGIVRYAAEYAALGLEFETTINGAYGGFALWGQFDTLRLGVDGYVESMVFDEIADTASLTPGGLGVLGVHVGAEIAPAYVGTFGALGFYPDGSNTESLAGVAGGVEGLAQFGAVTLFSKLGYAFAPSDDYDKADDKIEGFMGPFVEAGLIYALADDLAVLASVGFGHSADFDSTDEPGDYAAWGLKVAYRLPTELNLNLIASYDGYHAEMMDGDETVEHTFKLGLSIPFGDGGTAAQALNPLATSLTPFRAAYTSDAL